MGVWYSYFTNYIETMPNVQPLKQRTTPWRELLARPVFLLWMGIALAGIQHVQAAEQAVPPADSVPASVAMTVEPGRPNYPGNPLTISAVLQKPDASEAEYQFLVDHAVIQSWSPLASCQWVPVLQDIGKHQVEVQVRSRNGMTSQQESIYIYRRPVVPSDYDPSAD